MPLSSAAGAGGYAKRLATVFLRPYGLALPCGGTSPVQARPARVARNDTQTWWDVEGEIRQLPTPNVYRSPTSQGGRGGPFGSFRLGVGQTSVGGSRELSQYAPINASMFKLVN